jgi:hypothetical protein
MRTLFIFEAAIVRLTHQKFVSINANRQTIPYLGLFT